MRLKFPNARTAVAAVLALASVTRIMICFTRHTTRSGVSFRDEQNGFQCYLVNRQPREYSLACPMLPSFNPRSAR
jgi:hypothetical protein